MSIVINREHSVSRNIIHTVTDLFKGTDDHFKTKNNLHDPFFKKNQKL